MRCIIWSHDSTVLVGDLGGNIYSWIVNDGVFELWTTLGGSVIHLRQSHSKKVLYYISLNSLSSAIIPSAQNNGKKLCTAVTAVTGC